MNALRAHLPGLLFAYSVIPFPYRHTRTAPKALRVPTPEQTASTRDQTAIIRNQTAGARCRAVACPGPCGCLVVAVQVATRDQTAAAWDRAAGYPGACSGLSRPCRCLPGIVQVTIRGRAGARPGCCAWVSGIVQEDTLPGRPQGKLVHAYAPWEGPAAMACNGGAKRSTGKLAGTRTVA
jgi:hypothetical protein